MGISDVVLHMFNAGRPLSIEMCIRLAKYLGMPTAEVLRMAGHGNVAVLLEENVSYTVVKDPPKTAMDHVLDGLTDDEKQVAITAVIGIAEGLKKRRRRKAHTE